MKSLGPFAIVWKALFLCVLVIQFYLGGGCTDNSLTHVCADPLGSEDITISRCDSTQNLDRCYFCFGGEKINTPDTCFFDKCFRLYSDTPSSDWIIWSWLFTGGCSYGVIVDMGTVSCLGGVNSKPSSGYVYSVTPKAGHGYVVKFPDDTYARFFVQKTIKNSAGRDSLVSLTRQYPF